MSGIISRSVPPTSRFDAILIGGGHNGLTCAAYLAAAGLEVAIFERRGIVGGAAVTEEFHPGFRNSTASYTVSLLSARVIRDLRLAEHGLRILERPMQNFLPLEDGRSLCAGPELAQTIASLRPLSARDAARLPAYHALLDRVVGFLRELLHRVPPTDLRRTRDLFSVLREGIRFRGLPIEQQREIHELFTRSAGHFLDGLFESDALKALYGFDAVVGNYASPYAAGSAYVLLHHAFGEVNGRPGVWGHAVGGMGAITQAMAAEARRRGVHIEVDAPVLRVLTETRHGAPHATGIELADGRVITAPIVASNVNPKLLFERLVAKDSLPPEFIERIRRYRCGSGTLRINVALAELPDFTAMPGLEARDHHRSGIILAPSLAYMDRAHAEATLHGHASQPIVEMLIPSTVDDSLAPRGAHVASLFCQHFAPELPAGRSWDDEREAATRKVFAAIDRFAPNFTQSVLGYRSLTPLDLEREFGLTGGDIFHGALGLDQLWAARPILGYGDHRTPVRGLYLCGSGSHPGGGVTGIPGYNAARVMLRGRGRPRG